MARCIKIKDPSTDQYIDIPAPAYGDGYKVSTMALDSQSGTFRSRFTGLTERSPIAVKRQVSYSKKGLDSATIAAVYNALQIAQISNKWLDCKILTPASTTLYEGQFYVTQVDAGLDHMWEDNNPIWGDLSFQLTER